MRNTVLAGRDFMISILMFFQVVLQIIDPRYPGVATDEKNQQNMLPLAALVFWDCMS
jgi:hypothetical protein